MPSSRIVLEYFRLRAFTVAMRLLCVLALSGCATTQFVELREKPRNPLTERFKTTRIGLAIPSPETATLVRNAGYHGPPTASGMLKFIHRASTFPVAPDRFAACAELNYLTAEANRNRDSQLSSELYLDAAEAAWRYFTTEDATGRVPDPSAEAHRATAEIYNASVESILRIARKHGNYRFGRPLQMPLTGRRLNFSVPRESPLVNRASLGDYRFVSDYELKNLRSRHIAHGLGVPVIAVRRGGAEQQPVEQFYTEGMSFSATVVLRFGQSSSTSNDSEIEMEVYDPRESDGFYVSRHQLPLEMDFSTPLAQYLSNPGLSLLDTWGLVRPDRVHEVAGLYMVQPWDPDRIPVLMVHGLWSSPMTWMEMFNDLQADPDIRRRYQFWFYLYPSGEPLAVSAANLRDELERVRDACDPHRRNENLDRMIMVGHSMGGLISHLLTIDSEDRLWNAVSRTPVEQLQASEEDRHEIRRVFFFNSHPSISRIVTIASPYAGSRYSNPLTQWLASSFIWLPGRTLQMNRLLQDHSGTRWTNPLVAPRTSVDSLRKQSGVLQLIRATSVPEDIAHHNIVGVRDGSSAADWSDGVVSWHSSHREDCDSELVVAAGHSEVHRHPEAIREVRRILLEHLRMMADQGRRVIPVNQQARPRQVPGILAP